MDPAFIGVGSTLAHYRILAPIGSGGMGHVYRAYDTHLERDVAIKVLPPELFADDDARRRFRREALALSRLQHPHIAVVHDFAEEQGVPYLVMELIEGETLEARLRLGPMDEAEIRRVGVEIASALSAAHERHIVHRDLKPGNVMLTPRDGVKVLDFGLAKRLTAADPRGAASTLTVSDTVVGTLHYMAPEQLLGRPVDGRTDVFALGAMLYEMATGTRPFRGDTAMAIGNAILNEGPAPPRALVADLSVALDATILRCLEKHPEDRIGSADDVMEALQSHAVPASVSGVSMPATTQRTRRSAGSLALVVLSALAVVAFVGRWILLRPPVPKAVHGLAVLPLVNLSSDPDQEFFADGMTDELIVTLSQIAALKVISRSSSMSYKRTTKTNRQIARELGVDALVTGSVQRSGQRLRVRAELVDAAQDRSLWADGFERELTDALTVQQDVARAIVERIHVKLQPQESRRLTSRRSVDPTALEAYLRGRFYWNQFTVAGWNQAREQFMRAIELDPQYAPAYAGLADAYIMLNANVIDPREAVPRARAAVEKALQLEPDLAAAHATLGYIEGNLNYDWKAAEASYRRALELNPNEVTAHQNYGYLLHVNGRFDEALRHFMRAKSIDPLSTGVATMALWPLNQGRRYREAIAGARRLLSADSSGWYPRFILAQSLAFDGQHSEAVAEFQRVVLAEDIPLTRGWLGWAYARAGRKPEAERILRELQVRARREFTHPYGLVLVCIGLGRNAEALDWLESAVAKGIEEVVFINVDPAMDPLREDPRFRALLVRLGFASLPPRA